MPIPVRGNHEHDARGLDNLIVGFHAQPGRETTMSVTSADAIRRA